MAKARSSILCRTWPSVTTAYKRAGLLPSKPMSAHCGFTPLGDGREYSSVAAIGLDPDFDFLDDHRVELGAKLSGLVVLDLA
jgi:hypothetical protein